MGNFTVRRYGHQPRVLTEVQPSYTPPSAASAKMADVIKSGFDEGVKFLRPAVEQEQTAIGEKQAIEAFEKNSFEMRKPFSIRDQAFNATGERLVTNRAMIELDEGFRNALKNADGSITKLDAEMQKLQALRGDLPNIPGLEERWLETFERGAVTARRQTTELAERRAIAAATQSAATAVSATELEVARLALTAGTEGELTAAMAAGINEIAQYGPREAFTLNGVEYPADPKRSGIYNTAQLAEISTRIGNQATELFLRADYERSDSPAQWAAEFEKSVLAGESPLPPDRALSLLNSFESAARADESARRTAEARVEADLRASLQEGLNPYVVAQENGMLTTIPEEEKAALRGQVIGNPTLAAELEVQFAAADAVAAMSGMNASQRIAYIERYQAMALETPGISTEEAAVINTLTPYLKAARSAISRETVGVRAAEQLQASGGMLTADDFAGMRERAGGNPEILETIAVLEEAQALINDGAELTGAERKEWLDTLAQNAAAMGVAGDGAGAMSQIYLEGVEKAQEHFKTLEALAQDNPAELAARTGVALEPFPAADATLPDVADVLVTRIGQIDELAARYGNDNPVPLSHSEREAISDWMANTNNSQRMAFLERINSSLPGEKADAVIEVLGMDNPSLLAAGRVYGDNPSAARTILAGHGARVDFMPGAKTGAAVTIRPFIEQLSERDLENVETTAEAYAKGLAVRDGRTEVMTADLELGYDIAMGADERGRGGIEDADRFGTLILPAGITGKDFVAAIDRIAAEPEWLSQNKGAIRGLNGEVISSVDVLGLAKPWARDIPGAAVSFIRTPGGGFAPIDAAGGLFLTDNGPLVFTLEELFPDG